MTDRYPLGVDQYNVFATGLTKREFFAGMALQGSLAAADEESVLAAHFHATVAVQCADALLAELNKEPGR